MADHPDSTLEQATLGGGCFWCMEAAFQQLRGVKQVVSGYAGGRRPDPTYAQVCAGVTGHAEVVQISFDPAQICYRDLLQVFFSIHDPTTLNRQGNDVGSQYRSIILWHDEAQKAEAVMAELEQADIWGAPIVTEVVALETFWPAEHYHQDYFANNPGQPYCQMIVAPKVAKVRKLFEARLQD